MTIREHFAECTSDLEIPKEWQNHSYYGGDECPSFMARSDSGGWYHVYIDHKNPERRRPGRGHTPRIWIQTFWDAWPDGSGESWAEGEAIWLGDSFEDALRFLKLAAFLPVPPAHFQLNPEVFFDYFRSCDSSEIMPFTPEEIIAALKPLPMDEWGMVLESPHYVRGAPCDTIDWIIRHMKSEVFARAFKVVPPMGDIQ